MIDCIATALVEAGRILLYPCFLFFLALIISFLGWKKSFSKKLLFSTIIIFYFCCNGLIPAFLAHTLEEKVPPVISKEQIYSHQAMVVLGGGIDDSTFSTGPSLLGYSRIMQAVSVYYQAEKMGVDYTIFLTGGYTSTKPISEATLYKKMLIKAGIPSKRIITENNSKNTFENAKFTAALLKEQQLTSVLLITSALHMQRSIKCFEHFGITVTPAAADFPWPHIHWFPHVYNLAITTIALHEIAGLWQFSIYRWLKM